MAAAEPPPEEERKVITALFTDIVGSTATAEQLDPEDVRARLAPYYARLRKELESFGGTVEKFIGDAVVALFGAPVAHEDDPERAVRAAIAITNAVAELNAEDAWLDLHIRTAVHTGEALVVVGARAEEGEGLAAGDVMNTAARLQSGASVDGIVVGEATRRATEHAIEYREAKPVQAKGKAEPIPIWAVVGEKAAPERPQARTSLVGRRDELALLARLWERAVAERTTHLVTVLGAPGIGKTRLLVALCDEAEQNGAVHWGRCLPYGEGITYWPVIEIFKDAAGIRQSDDAEMVSTKLGELLDGLPSSDPAELRTMAAALANLIGPPRTPRGTYSAAEISQAELHWGIRRVLQLLAAVKPVLIVFEDLHWAEPTLLELVRYLHEDAESPLLIVASARPELADSSPAVRAEGPRRHILELEPLGEDEGRALLAGLVGADATDARLATLLERAAGNPLFLEEIVAMVAQGADLESMPVPDSLQALIGSRLDALAVREKRVAQHASIVGSVFWAGAVGHLQDANGDLGASLATLERRDFVHANAESSIAGDQEYAFKHILIRDVAYERLPKGRRAELHVRFVDWLAQLPAGDEEFVEIVGYHLEQSCLLARGVARSPIEPPVVAAVGALTRAAEKAERREGIREAERYYARALDLVDGDHPDLALDLRLRRARTSALLGEVGTAVDELSAVAEEALALSRTDLRSAALVTLSALDLRRGRGKDARQRLTEAESLAAQAGDPALHVKALFELSSLHTQFDGDFDSALDKLRQAVEVAERIDGRALHVEGHLRTAFVLFNVGDLAGCKQELERCIELAAELGSRRDETRALYLLGFVEYYLGELAEAERLGLEARGALERTGETYFQIQNLVALAIYALARDDLAAAERRLQEAIPLALEEAGWLVAEIYRYLTETLVRQGRVEEAAQIAEFAARDVPEEDLYAKAQVRLAAALAATAERRREDAVLAYDEARELFERQHMPIPAGEASLALARALESFGDAAATAAELGRARETFDRLQATRVVGEIDRRLAELRSGAGAAGPARSH